MLSGKLILEWRCWYTSSLRHGACLSNSNSRRNTALIVAWQLFREIARSLNVSGLWVRGSSGAGDWSPEEADGEGERWREPQRHSWETLRSWGQMSHNTAKCSLPLTLCRLALMLTYSCRSAQEIFTSKLNHHFLVVQYVPVLSLEHVVVAVLQILQQHL